MLISDFL